MRKMQITQILQQVPHLQMFTTGPIPGALPGLFIAGFSYDLTYNTKLDLGYTYSRIEGGDMFQWLDRSGTQGYDTGFDSHVVRAGLRYQIW